MHGTSSTTGTSTTSTLPTGKFGWAKAIAIFTIALGLVVLCGWALDIDALKRLLPGLVSMKANTAAAFAVSGISLYLHTLRQISPATLLARRLSATLVLLLGLVTLCEYHFGWNAGIDQLMFSEPAGEVLTSHPGRMSTITATSFALVGSALLLMEATFWMAAQAAAFAVAASALLPLGGYMFGNLSPTHIGNTTAIAAHTAAGFLILSMGILAAMQNHGLMLRLRKKSLVIGLAISLITLIVIFGAASYNFVQKGKASQWVEHTYEVIQGMESFSASLHDFLNHNRGFLITGDERQLTERNVSRDAMLAELAKVYQLTSHNAVQQERLAVLDKLVRQRVERADLLVRVRREKGLEAAAAMIFGGKGDTLTDEIEAKLDELENTEKDLLKERQRVAEVMSSSSLFTLGTSAAASLLLLLWVFRTSQREITERKQAGEKLRIASLYTRSLIEASIDPLVTINAGGKITDVNKATEEATGLSRNELIGTDFSSYFTKPEKAYAGYRQVFEQGFVRDYPLTLRHKSGRAIDVLYNATVYRDDTGKVQGVFAAARDVTERKKAEEYLQNSEHRLKEAQRIAHIGDWNLDLAGNVLTWSDEIYRLFELDPEEFHPSYEAFLEAIHPDDRERVNNTYTDSVSSKTPYGIEHRLLMKDGRVKYVNERCETYYSEDGKPLRSFGTVHDITDFKRAEEALRKSEEQFRAIFENAAIGIARISTAGQFLEINEGFCRVIGYTREEVLSQKFTFQRITFPEDLEPDLALVNKLLDGASDDYMMEKRYIRKDESIAWVNLAVHLLRDNERNPLYFISAVQDITERKLAEQELREKEERLALATIHNGVGVWDWNLVTQEMIWDDSMFSLYHIRREDFIGTEEAWRAALHPDDLHRGDQEVNDAIAGKKPFDTEFRVVWPNGEIHHIKAVAKVFRDAQGTPLRMLGINMDITELRQTSIALQEKTNLLRNIIDSSADYIFAKDMELHTILCNEIFAHTIGKHVGDLIGKTDIENGWDPESVKGNAAKGIKGYEQDDLDAIAGKTIRSVDQLYVDGELRYVDTVKLPLRDDAGHTLGMFGISRDITENKFRENIQMARLRLTDYAANHTLKELLIATLDEACALTGSSVGFYHFLDADQKTLSLQAWSTRTTREFCKAEGEGSHYAIDQAGVWVDCVRERRPVIHNDYAALPHKRGMPPGHAHVEREMVVPIFRNELIVAILGVGNKAVPYKDNDLDSVTQLADLAWDIAVAKRATEEVFRLNAELERRVVERTASLEVANKDMESFSYSISHDLRAPLRAINGFSKILQEEYVDRLDDEGKRLLNVVGDNAQKMGELIDDILAFSRAGRNEINRSVINMEKMVAGVWEELKPDMAGRNVRLELRDIPPTEGDAAMIHQVVFNLLSNAVKFTRHRTDARIEVGGHADGQETVYHVKDNGVGFDMQYADKLFGVFLRLHGMDEFEGTGIGLAIVKRIITKHGGRVWAEGKVNEGATIYFSLPDGNK